MSYTTSPDESLKIKTKQAQWACRLECQWRLFKMLLLRDDIDYSCYSDSNFSYLQSCYTYVRSNIINKINLGDDSKENGFSIMKSFRQLFEIHMYMCEIADHEQDILLSELVYKYDDDLLFAIDNLVRLKLGKIFGVGIWFDFESEDLRKNHDIWIWTIE